MGSDPPYEILKVMVGFTRRYPRMAPIKKKETAM